MPPVSIGLAWLGADRHREGRPGIDRSLPALEVRIGRAYDRKLQAALHDRAERNVGDGEAIEREPIAPGDVAIQYFELGERIGTLMLPPTRSGKTDASTTRKPSTDPIGRRVGQR